MPTRVPSPFLFVVTRGDSIGGAQIHVRDLARRWKSLGAEVHVAVGTAGSLTQQLEESGIPFHLLDGLQRSIHPLHDLSAVWRLRNLIRRIKPRMVSSHTAKAGLVARLGVALSGVPCLNVFTAHGWQFAEGISVWQKAIVLGVEKFTAWLCHRIITVSDYDYELALGFGIARPPRLVRVHNGMPDRPVPQRQPWDGGRTLRLVMVARLQIQKDHATLFRALVAWKHHDWKLDLVGDGPRKGEYVRMVSELGLEDKVSFLGQRMDAPEILDRSDLFLLISHWEGFPRSILEAMRSALPVVASDVGGTRESVLDGVTGHLVARCDAAALTSVLDTFLKSPALLRTYGEAGRRRFEERFAFSAMEEATLQAYNFPKRPSVFR